MHEKMDTNIFADPNINYSILESAIMKTNNKYMPIKKVNFQKYKHKRNDWITLGILNSIKHRDELYKKIRITEANTPLYDNLHIHLKTFNTILKRSIRIAKKTITLYNSMYVKMILEKPGRILTIYYQTIDKKHRLTLS